ncbi:DUF3820 family protein [Acidithiobacillus sp. MC6.1]|nr:DUF3820 family protein [Acidithiobacillus sp. MC6.1]
MTTLIFDTETTGRDDPVLIEAAWLSITDIGTMAADMDFVQRCKPGKPIETGALATHHILDEELVDCPAADTFRLPEGVDYLVGHNIDYDWEVIGKPDIKRICTLAMARKLWPDADSFAQSALMYRLANNRNRVRDALKAAHSALADVKFCRFILSKILTEKPMDSWDALWAFSEAARVPDVMPFGKHRGVAIKDLPKDYVNWALKNLADMDPYLRKALECA